MTTSHHYDKIKQVQSKRSNVIGSNSRTQFNNSNDQSDYQIVIQFQLRREREKTRILQQRLHNKQVFIQQMKEYQDQLTLAFEKCQQELIACKKALQKHYIIQQNIQMQNVELKQLIIRLQQEINLRQNKNNRHYSSVTKERQESPVQKREIRAKTQMDYEQSPKGVKGRLQEQVMKESKKITQFIKQFLMMSSCFCSFKKEEQVKNKLKISWKWIKEVVKQWNDLQNEKQVWQSFLEQANQKGRFSRTGDQQEILNKILSKIHSK